ncbi:hypothetical protein BGZ57DRAFT_854910 [Hyaloscypha finlandica]|nr:hypothetical protein BGZ57DRAFT_854910 [Hyaloscypha finlandica]
MRQLGELMESGVQMVYLAATLPPHADPPVNSCAFAERGIESFGTGSNVVVKANAGYIPASQLKDLRKGDEPQQSSSSDVRRRPYALKGTDLIDTTTQVPPRQPSRQGQQLSAGGIDISRIKYPHDGAWSLTRSSESSELVSGGPQMESIRYSEAGKVLPQRAARGGPQLAGVGRPPRPPHPPPAPPPPSITWHHRYRFRISTWFPGVVTEHPGLPRSDSSDPGGMHDSRPWYRRNPFASLRDFQSRHEDSSMELTLGTPARHYPFQNWSLKLLPLKGGPSGIGDQQRSDSGSKSSQKSPTARHDLEGLKSSPQDSEKKPINRPPNPTVEYEPEEQPIRRETFADYAEGNETDRPILEGPLDTPAPPHSAINREEEN